MANPAAEVPISTEMVQALLAEQFEDLAGLQIERVAEGWDNVVFRLGDDQVVRVPRREVADVLLVNEHRWGGVMIQGLDLPIGIGVPSHLGVPGCGFPWHFTIGPWFVGRNAHVAPPGDPSAAAETLGAFLALLHRPAPPDGPKNLYRGIGLAERDDRFRRDIATLADTPGSDVDVRRLEAKWEQTRRIPEFEAQPVWLHGDVHPLNLIVDDGVLVAAVDLGDLCIGDPASDLAVGWMLFDAEAREPFRAAVCQGTGLGPDPEPDAWDALWCRGWGWALALGVAFANGDDRVRHIGLRTLRRAIAEPPAQLT